MTTEQYSIGYDEGYQAGWNAAMDAKPAQQEPVAQYIGESSEGSLVQLYDDVKKGTNFYKSPPAQRKPLTDEEIQAAFFATKTEVDNGVGNFRDGVRFAEAAHNIKEKNT